MNIEHISTEISFDDGVTWQPVKLLSESEADAIRRAREEGIATDASTERDDDE